MRIVLNICIIIGKVFGTLSSFLFPKKLEFLLYLMRRAAVTCRNRHYFNYFGKDSMLAGGVKLFSPQYIHIGHNSSIMSHCVLETCPDADLNPKMIIGDNVSIGEYSHITCANYIKIADGVLTGRFVLITDNGHGRSVSTEADMMPLKRKIYSKGKVIIGKNVWIGDKATILPDVTIGDGAIIAANTVVSRDVPPYTVVAGCPARVVKTIK